MTAATRPPRQDPPKPQDRKARLAAALKTNIARRKAQVAAKAETDQNSGTETVPTDEQQKDV